MPDNAGAVWLGRDPGVGHGPGRLAAAGHFDETQLGALVLDIATDNLWNRLHIATRRLVGEQAGEPGGSGTSTDRGSPASRDANAADP